MNALRLSLAMTVSLILLGGLSSVAAAQAEADPPAGGSALLDFTVDYGWWTNQPSPTVEEGRNCYRDSGRVIDLAGTGDPRLSGQLTMTQNYDRFHDSRGSLTVGSAHISNDDGAWRGAVVGYGVAGDRESRLLIELRGEGAYEGLSALLFLDRSEESLSRTETMGSFAVEGVVFPGVLPPMPGPTK